MSDNETPKSSRIKFGTWAGVASALALLALLMGLVWWALLVKLATRKPNGDDQEAPSGRDKPLPVADDALLGGGAGTAAAPVPVTDPTTLGGSAPAAPVPVGDPESLGGGSPAPAPPLPVEDPEELDGN